MKCPDCDHENFPGADLCERCGQSLSRLHPHVSSLERYVLQTRIGDLPLRSPICVDADLSLRQAAQAMDYYQIGCLLVTRHSRVIGIITERDLLEHSSSDSALDQSLTVAMTPDPEACTTDDNLAFVVQIMSEGDYRHVPVMEGGEPKGLVSSRDVLEFVSARMPEDDSWMDRIG